MINGIAILGGGNLGVALAEGILPGTQISSDGTPRFQFFIDSWD